MRTLSRRLCFFALMGLSQTGCENGSTTTPATSKDTSGSTTEMAVGTVGGAVVSTSGNSLAWDNSPKKIFSSELMNALAPVSDAVAGFGGCPTSSNRFSGTCQVLNHSMVLGFPARGCVYGEDGPIWIGGTVLTTGLQDSSPACGTYPILNGTTIQSLTRTYLGNLSNNPTARTTASGSTTVIIDTSSPSTSSFVNASDEVNRTPGTIGWQYSVNAGGGYQRNFVSPSSQNLLISSRVVEFSGSTFQGTVLYDHTLSTTDPSGSATPMNLIIVGAGSNQTQLLNGTLYLQHNLMKMTAKAVFNNTLHVKNCCFPVSGSVATSFTGGANDGLTETMTFSQDTCTLATLGQVQLTDINGNTFQKTLKHCL